MSTGREYDSTQNQRPPWKVLSLDGGVVRGLAELLILKKIFEVMAVMLTKRGEEPKEDLRPCDFFDLIGGTSTGGLIALMLGRLRLNLPMTIRAFQDISRATFPIDRKRWTPLKKYTGGIVYNEGALETRVKRVIKLKFSDENLGLKERSVPKCRVFVCTTQEHTNRTKLLRSYNPIGDFRISRRPLKIWEAARATSAAPLYFKPMTIKSSGISQTFSDGAFHDNNPINQVMNECYRIDPGRKVGCVISLGTGVKASEGPKGSSHLITLAISLAEEASNCDRTHRLFTGTRDGGSLADEQRYFRFSVGNNLDQVNIDEWESPSTIQDYVDDYAKEHRVQIQRCAELLLNSRMEATQLPNHNEQRPVAPRTMILPESTSHDAEAIRRHSQASSRYPVGSSAAAHNPTVSILGDSASVDHFGLFALNTAAFLDDAASIDQFSLLTFDGDTEQDIADEINAAEALLEQGSYDYANLRFQVALALLSRSPRPMPSSFHCQAHLGAAECRISKSDDKTKERALEYLRSAHKHAMKAIHLTDDASLPAARMALLVMTIKETEIEAGPGGMGPIQASTLYGKLNQQIEVLRELIDMEDDTPQRISYKGLLTRGEDWRRRLIYLGSEGQAFQGLPPHYG